MRGSSSPERKAVWYIDPPVVCLPILTRDHVKVDRFNVLQLDPAAYFPLSYKEGPHPSRDPRLMTKNRVTLVVKGVSPGLYLGYAHYFPNIFSPMLTVCV